MKKAFSIHYADKGSDEHPDGTEKPSVARRGKIAGKMIGRVEIEDGVSHSCVLPDDIEAREVPAFIAADFEECEDTLSGDLDVLQDRREMAAVKRAKRLRDEERRAAELEAAAAKARG